MDRSSALTERLVLLILAGGLAVMGCGGGSDEGGGAAPASQEGRQAETEVRDGEDGRGEDGESGGSSRAGSISQSSGGASITQSTGGGSISQSSGGGSVSSSNVNGRGIRTFSGTGRTKLSFDVEQRSRLVWTNSEGRRFSASGAGISIDSRAGRGEVALEPGDYDDVRVTGESWTIIVRPR